MPRATGQLRLPGFDAGEEAAAAAPDTRAHPPETPAGIFRRVFRAVRPRTAMPEVRIEFRPFANANSFIRLEAGLLEIRASDIFHGAPATVLESLAYILICKLFRKPVPGIHRHRYALHLNRQDMRRALHLLRQTRGRKHVSGPQGTHVHLGEMFDDLNRRFFNGLMAQPALGWSRSVSYTLLGHFDPAHNAIILSRLLDQDGVPRFVVEYVLYHEMLHLRHPVETRGARRRVHTREFREAEKRFPRFEEAKAVLARICGSASLPNAW